MARKLLGYDDAVKILGGECKIITSLSTLAGAAITVASMAGAPAALGLLPLRDEITRLSQESIKALRSKLGTSSRFKRSELLEAAHAILVVGSFFNALDDLDGELGSALNSASLELTRSEQAALATNSEVGVSGLANLARELISPDQIPGLNAGLVNHGFELSSFYFALAQKVVKFAAGTSAWDARDETTRDRWLFALNDILPQRALTRYEEQLTQLSGEFPEFAFWAHRVGVQVILEAVNVTEKKSNELRNTLQAAAQLLATAAHGPNPDKVRAELIARYRDQIAKPVAGVAVIPDEVKLPSLQDLYVTPSYRMASQANKGVEQITEAGWRSTERSDDLGAMVLEHLITTEATRVPLVLLGQPGAGKSVFSQMLAAELDPRDYSVVRVELRAVPSDAGIQEQVEAGLKVLTGRTIRWPELAEAMGNAQPVIILDGFDELLQASGVSHYDFLERVQAFQEREAELDRPVAVLVTSRTAVANQVRYPAGTPVARLEEFDDDQVRLWLSVWNKENPVRPLATESALAQGELARQPLLLFLLALFHSGGGNLAPGISQAHLFDRLFNNFVERDVAKLDAQLTEKQKANAVQRDLDSLSMVAFAMFNRGRQSITETDLINDLTALQPATGELIGQSGRAAALSIADRMAGRFFFRLFLPKNEALLGPPTMLSTYEFLHASFGEFLVGRWIVQELSRISEQVSRNADDPFPPAPDDAKLHALLSKVALSTREQRVLGFIGALLDDRSTDELANLRLLVQALFRTALLQRSHDSYPHYQPAAQTVPAAFAAYSANLVLLALLIVQATGQNAGGLDVKISVADLQALGVTSSAKNQMADNFYGVTRLWHAQLTGSEWNSILNVIRIYPNDAVDGADSEQARWFDIGLWRHDDRAEAVSCYGILKGVTRNPPFTDYYVDDSNSPIGYISREAVLLGSSGYKNSCITLLPLIRSLGLEDGYHVFSNGDLGGSTLTLLLQQEKESRRAALYVDYFESRRGFSGARMILAQLREDISKLPATDAVKASTAAIPYAWTHIVAYLDIAAYMKTMFASPEHAGIRNRARATKRILEPLQLPDITNLYRTSLHDRSGLHTWRDAAESVLSLVGNDYVYLLQEDNSYPKRQDVNALFDYIGIKTPEDIVAVVALRDLIGLRDARPLRGLFPNKSRVQDVERSIEENWPDWPSSPILRIALWSAMEQRKLEGATIPAPLQQDDMERLKSVAPDFVNRTRELGFGPEDS
jgi:hypothetical protein